MVNSLGVGKNLNTAEISMLNKRSIAAAIFAMSVLCMAGAASAGVISPAVSVNGTVQAQCGQAVDGVMNITIDPSLTGNQAMTITTNATVKCTNQKIVTVSAASAGSGFSSGSGSLTGTMTGGGFSINYTLTFNSNITGLGFGAGKAVPILVSASVAQADAENAAYIAGSYTDTVTLTITY